MNVQPSRWVLRGLIVCATIALVLGWFGLRSLGNRADWLAFYAAGNFLLDGRLEHIYDPAVIQAWQAPIIGDYITRYLYAPAYSILYIPLALFHFQVARYVWLLVGSGVGILAALISRRWSGLSFSISTLSLLAFAPFIFSLAVGQMSPITLLLFFLIAGQEWQERDGYLPGALAGLVLFKPQLLIPLVFFWLFRRRWRSLAGFIGMAVAIALISLLVNPKASLAFIEISFQFLELSSAATESGANASFFALSPWVWILVVVIILTILLLGWRRGVNRYTHAMLWLTPVLVTPYIATYDLLLLFLPVTFLVPLLKGDRLLQVGVVLLYITPILAIPFMTVRPVVLVGLLMFTVCAWRVWRGEPLPDISEISKDFA